uniref:PilZ domain-containing protein n=1 Tax=Desulfobacca acetoxidans TaxID=60893 RepID=A0A7C3WMJ1_9BACT
MSLELPGSERNRDTLTFPVSLASLSAGGVVLRVEEAPKTIDFLNLKNREAIICLPHLPAEDLGRIRGRVLWSRPDESKPTRYAMGLVLADLDLRVRKVLEDRLQAYPKDVKELWDQWDLVQARRFHPSAGQAVYLVGAGAVAGGMTLYLVGPESWRLFGSILSLYGCLMMAARSVWAMWGKGTGPED